MEVEFDPHKAAENQRKHGVSFAHAEQVLRDPLAITVEDPDAQGEARFVTLGMDSWVESQLLLTLREKSGYLSSPLGRRASQRQTTMRKEYDFSRGKRGAVIPSPGKTRITIMIDDDILEAFRARAESAGRGYQTLMNDALRATLADDHRPFTAKVLRAILREEIANAVR